MIFSSSTEILSGEINDSFAYASSGTKISKISDQLAEETYGEPFGQSDVIGCYIDFGENENENLIKISFTKNGQDFGQAFEIDKTQSVFYPHILVKNVKFECNFGQLVSREDASKDQFNFVCSVGNSLVRNEIRLCIRSEYSIRRTRSFNGTNC